MVRHKRQSLLELTQHSNLELETHETKLFGVIF
jgi:hypothetical protein